MAEPGWTMFMVSHFHYDPVWWNTQGAYTSEWTEDPPGRARQTNGFDLVHAHLEMARREPEYKFVLAEVDYLKPYWDTRPEDRADLRRFIAQGRVEVMGGTYNEPNTNLTSPETTIRNLVHGMGFQRDVVGADPATAWQLDVFGHDPQFPGLAADAGLTSSSWARGPHHQWGPATGDGSDGGVERMQFSSEFECIAPSGRGLLTHYMPAHYSAGWWMDSAASLAEAQDATYALFVQLKKVALTRNVLLPVGTDYTPPNKWVTAIHRDWAARYTWPRFVCALPREFFAAVRAELAQRGGAPSPQTRDMNPIYTGKDVSYIDTKQANRAAENTVLAAERFAVFAGLLAGAEYPQAALAKAWVQLAYGAHHDAITGSESDQVYLDLLTGWRDAWELGRTARDDALALLSRRVDGADVTVWNPLNGRRTDVVTARLDAAPGAGVRVLDADGAEVPAHVEHGGRSVSWLARDVPALGWRAYRLVAGEAASGWAPLLPGSAIANEHYRLAVDAERGGTVASLIADGRELIGEGRVGNELAVYEEYPSHPSQGEGPWHLLPKGPVVCSSATRARVRAFRGPLGERVVVHGRIGTLLRYTQTLTLWRGVARVDCRTTIDEFTGADRLVRLRWPCPVPGAMPVSEVGDAVVGRGFALLHDGDRALDTARHPWTLDNPAYGWFGLSSAARVRISDGGLRCLSVAEVVSPAETTSGPLARELLVALVRAGVTATCSAADGPRYGHLEVDSNLPDVRVALGGPRRNAFTAAVLADADPAYADELRRQLAATGRARLWVPARAPLAAVWLPDADLRDARALPVLVVDGRDERELRAAIAALVDDLGDAEITVTQQSPSRTEDFDDYTVALLNRGVPSFAVDTAGTLHTALLRSCTGWPSGIWIDDPRRSAPDGSNFQLQHWTHHFDYALVSGPGDWRRAEIPARSAQFGNPLVAVAAGGGAGAGPGLPPAGSLLRVQPAESVQLAALKAAGNPLASGSAARPDPTAVALRLVETAGAGTRVAVDSDVATVSDLHAADLLEKPSRQVNSIDLHGYQVATVLARLHAPAAPAGAAALAPHAEAAQPLYARYWLHNRGPAPLGGLPAVAHLHPARASADPDSRVTLRLSAASDCTDATLAGAVLLRCPDGWSADPAELPLRLCAGQHLQADIAVSVPARAAPGLYPVRAELRLTGEHLPASWRQGVEDVCVVAVGDAERAPLIYLADEPAEVTLEPGEAADLTVTVGSHARAELALEAHLISPWGTWDWMGPAAVGAVLPARGAVDLGFRLAPPAWLDPGQWWALVRIGCAGELLYSPAVRVTVT
ncbi:alpha-mannosidase [Mycobacterium avium subsp. hominissuis]|uniref:Alpha-mannosidase n=2 Tax=Mycobacterium avium TaxID=1764 RepID=A0AAI8X4P8_MYCAV|nr:alpha-mannosidase [Mycobacterium avium subsp. hominissuis]